jgi:hypothetical protein
MKWWRVGGPGPKLQARPQDAVAKGFLGDAVLRADFAYRREQLFPICYSL